MPKKNYKVSWRRSKMLGAERKMILALEILPAVVAEFILPALIGAYVIFLLLKEFLKHWGLIL